MCEICSKLTIKTKERRHWRSSAFFIVTLNRFQTLSWCVHCWFWTSKYRQGKPIKVDATPRILVKLSVEEFVLQSNLYKTTTFGTTQKWLSWASCHLIKHLYKMTTNQAYTFLVELSQHIWGSVFAKIVNYDEPLSIVAKKLHRRY